MRSIFEVASAGRYHRAGVAELADATDSKYPFLVTECRFESDTRTNELRRLVGAISRHPAAQSRSVSVHIDFDFVLIVTLAIFLVAGVVKGLIGMGLPTIAMGLLAVVMLPAQAAAILDHALFRDERLAAAGGTEARQSGKTAVEHDGRGRGGHPCRIWRAGWQCVRPRHRRARRGADPLCRASACRE